MKIIDAINDKVQNGENFLSFEFFPPRTDDGVKNLYARFDRMKAQEPVFIDVTWGAGGSTSDLTLELCQNAKQNHGLEPNMHLTCTNMLPEKVDLALKGCKEAGIQNIVALRGDPPAGQEKWTAVDGGFTCALDLVKYIRKEYGDYFCLSVAGYPEGHPNAISFVPSDYVPQSEAERRRMTKVQPSEEHPEGGYFVCKDADFQKELAYLKEKVDAGADMIITQLFYDADLFIEFVKACREIGINAPILPGIMPIQVYAGFRKMTKFCKTRVPEELDVKIEELKDDADKLKAFGVEYVADMCQKILNATQDGVRGLHFYTLNLEKATYSIMDKLGLKKEDVTVGQESAKEALKGTNVAA